MISATQGFTLELTFLFTDIEGGARLWEREPDGMKAAIARHDFTLRRAIESNGGVVFKTTGDAFAAVFRDAAMAARAAVVAQEALSREVWPLPDGLRVRAALHTGTAEERDGDYFGPTLNRAARLLTTAHGGQIVLSQRSREALGDAHDDAIDVRDLGSHRLRDIPEPEKIYQLLHPSLAASFPPLRSLDALPNNLPRQIASFVGRARELAESERLLSRFRLVTLAGPGGAGKSRMAVELAANNLQHFPDGLWIVDLGTTSRSDALPQAVATVLGIREEAGRPLQETLVDYFSARRTLLVLDNCDRVAEVGGAFVADLLRHCQHVQVIVTSREPLVVPGEAILRVPPLPRVDPSAPFEEIAGSDAVRLFAERAAAASPGFALDAGNAAVVARICARVDGIPLAIELAAARTKILRVDQILERLHDRFRLLRSTGRAVVPWQQTMQATLDWSYELLSAEERALFRGLSVFAGGCTLSAAEAACGDDPLCGDNVLDVLTRLVDKSLVIVDMGDDVRYRMLETVREYARAKLDAEGNVAAARARHFGVYLALAEEAQPHLQGPDQPAWFARLDADRANLAEALDAAAAEIIDGTGHLRLASALWWFWYVRGLWTEGKERLTAALARGGHAPAAVRARVLVGGGVLAYVLADYRASRALAQEGLTAARDAGDAAAAADALIVSALNELPGGGGPRFLALCEEALGLSRAENYAWGIAVALLLLGTQNGAAGANARAQEQLEESHRQFERTGDRWGIAYALQSLGEVAINQGDYARARALCERSLELRREISDRSGIGQALLALQVIERQTGNYARAEALIRESLTLFDRLGDRWGHGLTQHNYGTLARDRGDLDLAAAMFEASLALFRAIGARIGIAHSLSGLGSVRARRGDTQTARAHLEESLALLREVGEVSPVINGRAVVGNVLGNLGTLEFRAGNHESARTHFTESLTPRTRVLDRGGLAQSLEGLGWIAAKTGHALRAATLLAAAQRLRDDIGSPVNEFDRLDHEAALAEARGAAGHEAFDRAWARGAAMTVEDAVAFAG